MDFQGESFKDAGKYTTVTIETFANESTAESMREETVPPGKPVMFIMPGLSATGQTGITKNMVTQATKQGYETVVINFRGLADAGLATPKIYNAINPDDALEAMTYVYNRYCKE